MLVEAATGAAPVLVAEGVADDGDGPKEYTLAVVPEIATGAAPVLVVEGVADDGDGPKE